MNSNNNSSLSKYKSRIRNRLIHNFNYLLIFILFCLGIGRSNGQYRDLLKFNVINGAYPYGSLTLSGNALYGMTSFGGKDSNGCIFSIHTNGSGYKDLHDFNDTDGSSPQGSLILSGNKLYGMTSAGGTNDSGCIFSIDTTGLEYKTLMEFNGTTGASTKGSLTLSGNKLYGMAEKGGAQGKGCVFSLDTNGSRYIDIFNFNGVNGANPMGDLTISGNRLYGMTFNGGADSAGTVFSLDTNGSEYTDLLNFNGANGEYPAGNLTLSENKLYGMTYGGGANGSGSVFSIDTNGGEYRDLLDFNGINGSFPNGSLTLSGSLLYGMTYKGGIYGLGSVFSIDTIGSNYNGILNFNRANGQYPLGSLNISGNVIYGMTEEGAIGNGVIFSYTPCTISIKASTLANESCNGVCHGSVTVMASGGTPVYAYSWSPGGATDSTVTKLCAGTYTITVTDSNECIGRATTTVTQPSAITVQKDSIPDNGSCDGIASLTASGGTAPYIYMWSTGITTDTIKEQCAGIYCCTITDNNSCSLNTCITVKLITGVNEIGNSSHVNIYPDPNKGYFTLSGITQGQVVELYNCIGQQVPFKLSILNGNALVSSGNNNQSANNSQLSIDISSSPRGIYLYRITSEQGEYIASGKFIIK